MLFYRSVEPERAEPTLIFASEKGERSRRIELTSKEKVKNE